MTALDSDSDTAFQCSVRGSLPPYCGHCLSRRILFSQIENTSATALFAPLSSRVANTHSLRFID
jgi:hypothetical protein